jgi:hypothetical protein
MTITYNCRECDHEFEISVTPIREARTCGRPEDCYPEEGGEFEPGTCAACGHEVDEERVWKLAADEAVSAAEAAAEARAEAQAERGWDGGGL